MDVAQALPGLSSRQDYTGEMDEMKNGRRFHVRGKKTAVPLTYLFPSVLLSCELKAYLKSI